MNSTDITPQNRIIPAMSVWLFEPARLDIYAIVDAATMEVDEVIRRGHLRGIAKFNAATGERRFPEELARLERECSPIRQIIPLATRKGYDEEWLGLWEVFDEGIFSHFARIVNQKVDRKTKQLREKDPESIGKGQIKEFPIRSFHIADNTGRASEVMGAVAHRLSFSTGAPIVWNWLANYQANYRPIGFEKNRAKWVMGVDGEGKCKPSNMRKWKNTIDVELGKNLDVITSHDPSAAVGAIAFTLMNLSSGGCAVIRVHDFSNVSVLTLTHLFANCFDHTTIINTIVQDNVYLCGHGFLSSNINSKHRDMLYKFVEKTQKDPETSLYATRFFADDGFTYFLNEIEGIQKKILDRRVERFHKLVEINAKLSLSSNQMFAGSRQHLIDEGFPDYSGEFAEFTCVGQIIDLTTQKEEDE